MNSGFLIFDSASFKAAGKKDSGHMLLFGNGNPLFRATSVADNVGGKRRPFFTEPDEYFDDEDCDEQFPGKKRRLSPEQVRLLERSFKDDNRLEPERKSELARKLGMQPRQVAVWFQNRRARWKAKQLERDFDCLKASYDSLLADHESLLKDNDHLRSQILSLTEKLQEKEQTISGVAEVKLAVSSDSSADLTALSCQPKSEDRVSSGSAGSAVVDGDGNRESCFPESYKCSGPIDGRIQSEEEDAIDEGCSYYPEPVFSEQHRTDDGAQLGWWVWG